LTSSSIVFTEGKKKEKKQSEGRKIMQTPLTPPTCRGSEHVHSVRSMSLTGVPLEDLGMATGGYSRDIDMSKFKVCVVAQVVDERQKHICAYVH
jgi:hypothetical protein